MKFRKKPVVIEAMQLTGSNEDYYAVYDWVKSHVGSFNPLSQFVPKRGISIDPKTGFVLLATFNGVVQVNPEDWIIRGVHGEFYPCKPDIFEKTYEPVDE